MEIVVFGSTGRTGSAVVAHALDRGHHVTAFARSPQKLGVEHANLRVAVGDAFDAAAVTAALDGADAAISTLGAGTLDPTTDLSTMTANVIAGARTNGVRRLTATLSRAVFSPRGRPPFQHIVEEHKRNLAALQASALAWVGACPLTIEDGPGQGSYEAVLDGPASPSAISRFDLADFLIDATESDMFVGHAVGVAGAAEPVISEP
jgi:putative NADH-flavin reductase